MFKILFNEIAKDRHFAKLTGRYNTKRELNRVEYNILI